MKGGSLRALKMKQRGENNVRENFVVINSNQANKYNGNIKKILFNC